MLNILFSGSSSGQESVGLKNASQREIPEYFLNQNCLGFIVKMHILGAHLGPIQLDSLRVLEICILHSQDDSYAPKSLKTTRRVWM